MPLLVKGKGYRQAVLVAVGATAEALAPLVGPKVLLGIAGMKLVRTREQALAHLQRALNDAPYSE
jgi:hypothetical protein